MNHDPKKLYQRINAAAMELRANDGTSLIDALSRVVDDMKLAGFAGLGEALGEVVDAAKSVYDGESEALAEMTAERDEAYNASVEAEHHEEETEKENEALKEKVKELESRLAEVRRIA